MTRIRLNHYIAQAGLSSRRAADTLIESGKIKVDGKVVKTLGTKIEPESQSVEILREKNNSYSWKMVKSIEEKMTLALYKPKGYVTSMKKQGSSPIISSLIPRHKRLYPIGRLDKDSEGLLIVTNDGDLSQQLMHPTKHVSKTYLAICITPRDFTENELKGKLGRLAKGVIIKDIQTQPSIITLDAFDEKRHRAVLTIVLKEGKNRQIRRMMGRIDLEVIVLRRVAIGSLKLDTLNLAAGKHTPLTPDQLAQLLF